MAAMHEWPSEIRHNVEDRLLNALNSGFAELRTLLGQNRYYPTPPLVSDIPTPKTPIQHGSSANSSCLL